MIDVAPLRDMNNMSRRERPLIPFAKLRCVLSFREVRPSFRPKVNLVRWQFTSERVGSVLVFSFCPLRATNNSECTKAKYNCY